MALPRIDAPGVRPVGPAEPVHPALPVGDARQEAFDRSLRNLVGRTVPVAVLARLADGAFLVRVAGTPARMALPAGAQVGTDIPLKVLPGEPRPAFQLAASLPSAPLTYSSANATLPAGIDLHTLPTTELSKIAAGNPARTPAPAADPAAAPQLSAAGKTLGEVLGAALKLPQPAAAVSASAPLARAPTADAGKIAAALEQAIGKSGLFYESHLAEWAGGARALADLQGEPQMAGGRNALEPVKSGVAPDPATAQLVSQQLSTQEQARVSWQGPLWPGQPMQWDIARDAPDGRASRDSADDGAGTPWRSSLRLRFAALGELGAQVVLSGEQLHIRLEAPTPGASPLLRAHAARLSEALAAAGITLSSLAIDAGAHD